MEKNDEYFQKVYNATVESAIKSGMPRESAIEVAEKTLKEVQGFEKVLKRSPDVEKMYSALRQIGISTSFDDAKAILEKAEEIITSRKEPDETRGLLVSELKDGEVYSCRVSGWNVLVLRAAQRTGLVYANTGYEQVTLHDGQLRKAKPGFAPFA